MAIRTKDHNHSSIKTIVFTVFFVIIIILLLFPSSTAPLEFNYPEIGQQEENLIPEGNVTFQGSEIVLTKAQVDNNGRVSFIRPFKLWERSSSSGATVLANFSTEFSFTIFANQTPAGDGIAFFLAKPPYMGPRVTDGRGIGLLSSGELLSTSQGLVAVEFDTFYNPDIDPEGLDSEHVGIDVNSMKSSVSAPWSCNTTTRHVYNATISYESISKNLSVVFTGYEDNIVPIRQHLSYQIDLSEYLPSLVSFGFSSANGLFTSVHTLRSWSFSSSSFEQTNQTSQNPNIVPDGGKRKKLNTWLVVGLSVGGGLVVIFTLLGSILLLKKRAKKDLDDHDEDFLFDLFMDNDFEKNSGAKKFSYNELLAATNNFSEEGKLGQGGFGGVYKGFLKNLNTEVAIKRVSSVSEQGIKEYAAEVKIISRLRHRNLVQLIGWCHRKKDLLLIYEFMPNGSLDSHLFKHKSGTSTMAWRTRYNVARGLAAALLYLHEEWEQCVLHRDIKASNVMLDSNFNAKLGDFGLARLVDHDKGSQTTALAGTLGYMAPECLISGRASRESDIYSFGVVALEIACGRKAIEANEADGRKGLVEMVWDLYGKEKILEASDPRIEEDFAEDQMERLMVVGLWCSHPDYGSRPSIKQVIQVLDFEASLPFLPKEMPVPTYLPRSVVRSPVSGFEIGSMTQSSTRSSQYTSSSQFTTSSGSQSASPLLY